MSERQGRPTNPSSPPPSRMTTGSLPSPSPRLLTPSTSAKGEVETTTTTTSSNLVTQCNPSAGPSRPVARPPSFVPTFAVENAAAQHRPSDKVDEEVQMSDEMDDVQMGMTVRAASQQNSCEESKEVALALIKRVDRPHMATEASSRCDEGEVGNDKEAQDWRELQKWAAERGGGRHHQHALSVPQPLVQPLVQPLPLPLAHLHPLHQQLPLAQSLRLGVRLGSTSTGAMRADDEDNDGLTDDWSDGDLQSRNSESDDNKSRILSIDELM
jgi:hypothetical protein